MWDVSDGDAALVSRVLTGEKEAYGILMERYRERFGRYATHLLGDRQDAICRHGLVEWVAVAGLEAHMPDLLAALRADLVGQEGVAVTDLRPAGTATIAGERVAQVIGRVHPSMLQFHGEETPAFCRSFGLPYLRAVRVRPGKIIMRNATVSLSMIITSMKLAVIMRTSYLKRDTRISAANVASDNAAAVAGRRLPSPAAR